MNNYGRFVNNIPVLSSASNTSFTRRVSNFFDGEGINSMKFAALFILVLFVVIIIYHKKVGYYVSMGWERMKGLMGSNTEVDIDIGPGSVAPPVVSATVAPYIPTPADNPPTSPMLPPEDRPSGMPGATTPGLLSGLSDIVPKRKEVFNVSRNIYTFHDAAAVCAAFNSELATYEQVQQAHKEGADWCNYGWVKGQMAVYPTQKSTYEKLQKGAPEFRNACGEIGVNGGYFDNPELRFGVTCYGVKPVKKATDEMLESQVALPSSAEEIEFEKRVQKFREQMDNTTILPFRKGQWSEL